jgi:hypothetical protein
MPAAGRHSHELETRARQNVDSSFPDARCGCEIQIFSGEHVFGFRLLILGDAIEAREEVRGSYCQ